MLSFSEALEYMKSGHSILRYSFNIETKAVCIMTSDNSSGIYEVNYLDHYTPFTPSYSDLVAEDWYVVGKR